MNVAILIIVAAVNFAIGVFAAAFFGYGPRRLQRIVAWIDRPPIRAPGFLRALAERFRRRSAVSPQDSAS